MTETAPKTSTLIPQHETSLAVALGQIDLCCTRIQALHHLTGHVDKRELLAIGQLLIKSRNHIATVLAPFEVDPPPDD